MTCVRCGARVSRFDVSRGLNESPTPSTDTLSNAIATKPVYCDRCIAEVAEQVRTIAKLEVGRLLVSLAIDVLTEPVQMTL